MIPEVFQLRMLADGVDIDAGQKWSGWDPDDILGIDSPILPVEPPRRVALYICGCLNPGCGSLTAVIRQLGDDVHWSDFRDVTGGYDDKPTTDDEDLELSEPTEHPDLVFDAGQYRAEITRASGERSWEQWSRATARLLSRQLRDRRHPVASGCEPVDIPGWNVGWARPHPSDRDGVLVDIEDFAGYHKMIRFRRKGDSPERAAARMLDDLRGTPPAQWPVETSVLSSRRQ
jgi:hypothetical protein